MSDFPTNPHSEYMKKSGLGHLTKDGKVRSHTLGRWTRLRYDKLIDKKPYHPELFQVISTSSDRTVRTAQLFLAGFYPPESDIENWNPAILWQPIPVYTDDQLLKMNQFCPRYNFEVERVKISPEFREYYNKYEETLAYIEKHRQRPIPKDDLVNAIRAASAFYDTLYVQDMLHLEHPAWAKEIYPLRPNIQYMFFKLHTYNYVMKRLKTGTFLKHLVNELNTKRRNPEQEKLFQFYSGHDSNIIAIMDTLGIWDEVLLPPYCAALLFELRKLNEDYIVTVSYRQSESIPVLLLQIPNCPNPCTLDDFTKFTELFIPEDLEKECKFFTPDYNTILF